MSRRTLFRAEEAVTCGDVETVEADFDACLPVGWYSWSMFGNGGGEIVLRGDDCGDCIPIVVEAMERGRSAQGEAAG